MLFRSRRLACSRSERKNSENIRDRKVIRLGYAAYERYVYTQIAGTSHKRFRLTGRSLWETPKAGTG